MGALKKMPKLRGACSVQLAAAVCCALAGSSAAFLVPSLARAPAVPGRLRAGVTQAHAGPGAESVDRRAAVLGAGAAAAWFVAGAPAGAQTEPPPLSRRAQKPGAMAPWEGTRPQVPVWELAGGVAMPTLALNTVALSAEDTERAVRLAMANGITHIDFHPGKERDGVAAVLSSEDVPREVQPPL